MSLPLIIFLLLITLCVTSVVYVYRFRGQARFDTWVEYMRKGWPPFAPLNVLLYLSTKPWARSAFVTTKDFRQLALLEENWQDIAEEANRLLECGYFDEATDKSNPSYYDVGFRTFYKYGWSKFYCSWYGTTHNSAARYCPKTIALLDQIPEVNGAMFTLLPAGSKLTRHLDPIACSLRYHLGLNTPNNENCYISVDGNRKTWFDGQSFLFDETYLHYVENNTDKPRLILMCDVERPMGLVGKVINYFYKKLTGLMLVPNLPGDKAGPINKLFSSITPFLHSAKQLKKKNRALYYPLKWIFNSVLLAIILLPIYGLLVSIMGLFQ